MTVASRFDGMNTRYRVIVAAMAWAYARARHLGLSAEIAADEALMVAQFIKDQ